MPLIFLIGFVYLMLLGGAKGFVSPDKGEWESCDLISTALEHEEEVGSLPEGVFTAINKPQKVRLYFSIQDYRFVSLQEKPFSDEYLIFSNQITPGLDIYDMIFPFHSFL